MTQNTPETLPSLRSMRFSWVYWILLAGITLAFVSLPFTHLDVGVRASAMLRPAAEKAAVITPLAGFVEELLVQTQQAIAQLRSPALEEQINHYQDAHKRQTLGVFCASNFIHKFLPR